MEPKTVVELCKLINEIKKGIRETSPNRRIRSFITEGGLLMKEFILWFGLSPEFKIAISSIFVSYLLSLSLFVLIFKEISFTTVILPIGVMLIFRSVLELNSLSRFHHQYRDFYRKLRSKLKEEARREVLYEFLTEFARMCGEKVSDGIVIYDKKYEVFRVRCKLIPPGQIKEFRFIPVPLERVSPSEFEKAFIFINSDVARRYHIKWRIP